MDTTLSPTQSSISLLNAQNNLAPMMQKAISAAQSSQNADIDMDKITKTAKEFEAVFISEMMKPMFENLKTDGMFGGGKGEEVFRGMLIQEYGKNISARGSIGLSDSITSAMIQMQEQASNQTNN